MQVVLIILSVGLFGVIIYFAASPRSSRLLKLASLAALGLIALSILVCGIFLIRGPGEEPEAVALSFLEEEAAPPTRGTNVVTLVVFVAIFVCVLALITVIAMRGQKKKAEKATKAQKSSGYTDIFEPAAKKPVVDDEESFDIDID